MARTVTALFAEHDQAIKAVGALRDAGVEMARIGIIARDDGSHDKRDTLTGQIDSPSDEVRTVVHAAEGSLIGGTAAGLITAAASLLIPGVGPLIAGGILAASILGGTGGWLIGGLAGLGITAEHAEHLQRQVEAGRALLTVSATSDEQAEQARDILTRMGAEQVSAADGATATQAPPLASASTVATGAGATGIAMDEPTSSPTIASAPATSTTVSVGEQTAQATSAKIPAAAEQTMGERIVFAPGKPVEQSGQSTILHVDEPDPAR